MQAAADAIAFSIDALSTRSVAINAVIVVVFATLEYALSGGYAIIVARAGAAVPVIVIAVSDVIPVITVSVAHPVRYAFDVAAGG